MTGYRRSLVCVVVSCGWAFFSSALPAQQLIVGNGATLVTGSSVIDMGCRDVSVAGTIDIADGSLVGIRNLSASGTVRGGSGEIRLSGDLAVASALQAQSGTVAIVDGCGSATSQLIGEHRFANFSAQTSAAHELVLPVAQTQFVSGLLRLRGGVQRLVVRSATPAQLSLLELATTATQDIFRVDAVDVGGAPSGQHIAPDLPTVYDSIDRGNTPRFFGQDALVPVPTLSSLALVSLIGLLLLIGMTSIRPFIRGTP